MGKVIVVTSGKGGVGKTTSSAALGAALAQNGDRVVVVDFDVGLRNLDLVMGAERRVVYDLVNVIQGEAKLTQALIRDKRVETLYLLPASQTRDKDNLTPEGVEKVIAALKNAFDWVICDSPAGIERGATLAMRHADVAIVVTNPEVSSVRDSDRIIGLLDSKTLKAENGERIEKHLLLTRYDAARAERGDMLKVDDVLEILSIPLLGIIPESMDVLPRMSALRSRWRTAAAPRRSPISKRRAASRAKACRSPSRATSAASSARSSEGKRHEPVRLLLPRPVGSGSARAAAGAARPRARLDRRLGPRQQAARRNPESDFQAHADRRRKGQHQDGTRRPGLDARRRYRDPVRRRQESCLTTPLRTPRILPDAGGETRHAKDHMITRPGPWGRMTQQ
jgi:septum site-determining protein MinD